MSSEPHDSLIEGCLRYLAGLKLPRPIPNDSTGYAAWRETAAATIAVVDEEAEDAWFGLDHLIAEEPEAAWRVLIEVASRCDDEDQWAQLAAGPLTTFLRKHSRLFAERIEEERTRNDGFRLAYDWLQ